MDEYELLLEEGMPFAEALDEDQVKANDDYVTKLAAARKKAMPPAVDPIHEKPFGDPELDNAFGALKPLRALMPTVSKYAPVDKAPTPDEPPPAHVLDVEPDWQIGNRLELDLRGLEPEKQSALLQVYKIQRDMNGGSAQAGYRTMVAAKELLSGNMTPEKWAHLETEAFGSEPEPRFGPVFEAFRNLSGAELVPIAGESDPLRVALLNAVT